MKRYDAINTYGDAMYAPSPDGEMVFYSDVAKWVSVKTELPTEWVSVLVGHSGYSLTGNAYRHNGQWRVSASNDLIPDKDITHWMNRPLPPSQGE